MKQSVSLLIVSAMLVTSCKDDQSTAKGDPRLIVPFTQQASTGIQNQSPVGATQQNHNLFRENNTVTTSAVAVGTNPAHGQPNHRCDIPVGAPLNSVANGTSIAQTTNMPVATTQTNVQTTAVKQVTAKGMNPPHGEKNHRCDIAVGAPLYSKSTQENTVVPSDQNGEFAVPALLATDKQ